MHSLILLVSMLGGGHAENSWLSPVFEHGSEIWSDRESAWQSLTAALEGLTGGEPNCDAEVALFGEEETLGTTVICPTFNFTTVTSTVEVPDGGKVLLEGIKRKAQSLDQHFPTPRIIIQEEDEEKLGLTIPEEPAAN